jgi:predicted ester cyclase
MDVTVHVRVEGQEMHLPARITAVLEQRGETWLILQLHGSLPAAEQEEGQAWPALPVAAIEEHKAIARRFIDEIWNEGNLEVVDELVAADVVWHNTPFNDINAFKQNLVDFRSGFPDLRIITEDLLAEGDRAVVRMTGHGTHAPTGKQVEWTGIGIVRIADAKIVEMWANEDVLGRLQQLGFELVPPKDESEG